MLEGGGGAAHAVSQKKHTTTNTKEAASVDLQRTTALTPSWQTPSEQLMDGISHQHVQDEQFMQMQEKARGQEREQERKRFADSIIHAEVEAMRQLEEDIFLRRLGEE
eukprot:CAMPEP_0179148420 /NCGR_PEP_ID=MMETSP0796-20121207/71825_1 /TAXON_ID=73915 /ORGANISM="Pyrodinium bahamense, Strain pbaha01" /LENGTH=107 /DNA_ID=CAMNT_0020849139 /DNA_START=20 /DNA_END=341 /DNA_ORIENTATION=-